MAPKILGRQFLTSLTEDLNFDKKLKEFCVPPSKPKIFSLLGVLDYIGVFVFREESQENIGNYKVDCLRSMIDIEKYQYKKHLYHLLQI